MNPYNEIKKLKGILNPTIYKALLSQLRKPMSDEKIIKICLDYAYHRLVFHKKTGITDLLDLGELDNLRYRYENQH